MWDLSIRTISYIYIVDALGVTPRPSIAEGALGDASSVGSSSVESKKLNWLNISVRSKY